MKRITCPRCRRSSVHPQDVAHGYCGNCHDYTAGTVDDVDTSTW